MFVYVTGIFVLPMLKFYVVTAPLNSVRTKQRVKISSIQQLYLFISDFLGAWQRVCIEASNHRKNVQYLEQLIMRVQELIGCAEIFINPFDSLTRNVEYMRSVIVRLVLSYLWAPLARFIILDFSINSQPKLSRMELRRLFIGLVVEIIHPYGQLALLKNGRLQVPCNININELKSFISESEILKTARYNQQNLEEERVKIQPSGILFVK